MIARSQIFCLIALCTVWMSGCVSAVKVPEEAELVWYGKPPVRFETLPARSEGQIYLFDDTGHKVVSVMPIGDRASFNPSTLRSDHDYALYFVARQSPPSLTARPTTSAAH